MQSKEIREKFLNFFKEKDHTIVASSSVIPENDPTLLFTNAGMNQFKNVLLGKEKREYKRAASSQKCIRAGGKHNDLEAVGKDGRHLTFFEMLGNWSFGDYYKKEAIEFAWEYLTEVLRLDKNLLFVSIYKDDEESFKIWHNVIGLSKDRIYRFGDITKGDEENFWSMGEIGPCGPCTEIYYYQENVKCDNPNCNVGCSCDRYIELWNNVFMEFNRDSSGKLQPLPMKSVDTGMGLERLTAIMQKVNSVFLTDLFLPIINNVEKISNKKFTNENATPFRVISDHIRTLTFAISDGCIPSNEGRGYVIRRILRRASRFGKVLEINQPFLYRLVDVVGNILGESYPEIIEKREYVKEIIKNEEERFNQTLDNGIYLFNKKVEQLKSENKKIFSGEDAFLLYDTYGFPLDLTIMMAEENNLVIDINRYNELMAEQQNRARKSSMFKIDDIEEYAWQIINSKEENHFCGYEKLKVETKILRYRQNKERIDLILEENPFYAESGGQISDTGKIIAKNNEFEIEIFENEKVENFIINKGKIKKGEININSETEIIAIVDEEKRYATQRNHTATHLLHKTLRTIFGNHIKQAGSYVGPDKLRFDFIHFTPISDEDLKKIEEQINQVISKQLPVIWYNTKLDDALNEGVTALFGEKYGDIVRVVKIDDYSAELCGGTHCNNISEIGVFKIISESSVSAGVRRIEAITGLEAIKYYEKNLELINTLTMQLKCDSENLKNRIEKIIKENENYKKQIEEYEIKMLETKKEQINEKIKEINGIKVYCEILENADQKKLMNFSDKILDKIKTGIVILGSSIEDKNFYIVKVSKDIAKEYSAKEIIKKINEKVNGSGGGKETMASGGCQEKEKFINFYNSLQTGNYLKEIIPK